MIQYALKCADGHTFDSWFQSAGAFDKLLAGGMLSCGVCGHSDIEKAIMTPRVRPARNATAAMPATPASPVRPLADPGNVQEQALAELRRNVEENSDYVGVDFATEARAMHNGESPERAIYGEAKVGEARALIEEGVPVVPLPFRPQRKVN